MPPEKNTRIKIITVKNAHIENLKIEGFRQKPLVIRNLTLKNVRFIIKLPSEENEK